MVLPLLTIVLLNILTGDENDTQNIKTLNKIKKFNKHDSDSTLILGVSGHLSHESFIGPNPHLFIK